MGPYRRRVRGFSALHGDGVTSPDEMLWVAADLRKELFGTTVPQEVVDESDSMIESGHKGIAEFQEYLRLVEQVGKGELSAKVNEWRSADSGVRTLIACGCFQMRPQSTIRTRWAIGLMWEKGVSSRLPTLCSGHRREGSTTT